MGWKVIHLTKPCKIKVKYSNLVLHFYESGEEIKISIEDIINSMLNYIYAIVRANIARSVSSSGLIPVFGLWHHNRYNAFNLVDDLIEPFRPLCDIYIKLLYTQKYYEYHILDINIKRDLVSILLDNAIIINNHTTTIPKAIDMFIDIFKRAMIDNESSKMSYPSINIEFFNHEFI